jgi:hypothetical protein
LTDFRFLGPLRLLVVLAGVYRVGCDCGTVTPSVPDGGSNDSGIADSGTLDSGTPDSGTPDGGAPDSGNTDGGATDAGCTTPVSFIGMSDGRASVIEVAGQPRVAYFTNNLGALFEYTECTAGCDTPDASWTPPVNPWPTAGNADGFRCPAFAVSGGLTAISAYRVGGSNIMFAECDGGCSTASNWNSVILDSVIGPSTSVSATLAMDVATVGGTTYRGLTTIARGMGAPSTNAPTYAECSGSSCLNTANWHVAFVGTTAPIFGTGVILRPEGAQLRRYVAFGGDTTADYLQYGDCLGTCAVQTDWLPLTNLRQGAELPSLAVNSAGVPRIAYFDLSTLAIRYTWCTSATPPCNSTAQWSDAPVADGGSVLSLKVGADDRARIAYPDVNGILQIATETAPGSGAFTSAPVNDCSGPISGYYPSLWLGAQDNYRMAFTTTGQTIQYTQQSP